MEEGNSVVRRRCRLLSRFFPPSSLFPLPSSFHLQRSSGFTLAEIVLGAMVLEVAAAAILGAYVGQVTLNEHARNLSLAIQDANRVIERVRQANSNCGANPPTAAAQDAAANWDAWVNANGGKSIQPNPANNELIVVTCQNNNVAQYCPAAQMGTEWHAAGPAGTVDPLRVTVAICWRHRNRTIGECAWDGVNLTANDTLPMPNDTANVIDSPAMLTTLVTCRG